MTHRDYYRHVVRAMLGIAGWLGVLFLLGLAGADRYYSGARYGEARIDSGGEMLLTGLRGTNLEWLGPPSGQYCLANHWGEEQRTDWR